MTQDPERLRDDAAAPELARALRGAHDDLLSPAAVARVRAALVVAGVSAGGAGLGAGARSASAKLLTVALGVRVGLACLGLAALGLAAGAWMRHSASQASVTTAPTVGASETAIPALVAPDPSLPSAVVSPSPTVDPVPASAAPTVAVGAGHARPAGRPSSAAEPSPREGALLLEARRALGTNPARSLALVHAHEQEFPASQLGPERARIAAEARQRLGK